MQQLERGKSLVTLSNGSAFHRLGQINHYTGLLLNHTVIKEVGNSVLYQNPVEIKDTKHYWYKILLLEIKKGKACCMKILLSIKQHGKPGCKQILLPVKKT